MSVLLRAISYQVLSTLAPQNVPNAVGGRDAYQYLDCPVLILKGQHGVLVSAQRMKAGCGERP